MIQETLDYLLTKSLYVNASEEEILDIVETEEVFSGLVQKAAKLMQNEDFFLIKKDYQDKLSSLIQEYRFTYNNEIINEDLNYIILRLREYKEMPFEYKCYLINSYYDDEYKMRNLPRMYQLPYNINNFIKADFHYCASLFKIFDEDNSTFEIDNVAGFISFLNMLLNRNSDLFLKDEFHNFIVKNLNVLLSAPLSVYDLMYAKKTLNNFNKQYQGKYKVKTI